MAAILPLSVIANQRARWCGNPFLPLAALVLQFVHIVTARRENCGLPLPVAEAGRAQFPQPTPPRAVAKQAGEWQLRQGVNGLPRQ